MKKYFYLCSLPRAGNTIFASMMGQNPRIKVTANSLVCDMVGGLATLKNLEAFKSFPDHDSFDNVMKNIIPNYYKNWDADYIIDRSSWGLPDRLALLEQFNPNEIKIIVLVRDLKEILASFIKFSFLNETNFIAKSGKTIQQRCDYLMQNGGELYKWAESVYNLTNTANRKYIHLIEYNDLVSQPEHELGKVYDFLGIPQYKHSFTNLSQLSNNGMQYDDSVFGGDLHKIKTDKVEKSKYNISDYLPDNVSQRYHIDNFWRHAD